MVTSEKIQEESKVIRTTGNLEKFHIARNSLGLDTSVVVAAQYLTPGAAILDNDTLYGALRRVIQHEPALRMAIKDGYSQSSSFPTYISCEVTEVTLKRICHFRDDLRWDSKDSSGILRFLDEELSVAWDMEDRILPLWKIVVCHDNLVLFFYCHGIGDGKSGLAFHVMFLEALNSLRAPPEDPVIARELAPPIENCMRLRPKLKTILHEVGALFIPISWTKLNSAWTGNPIPRIPQPPPKTKPKIHFQCRSELIELSPDDAKTFLHLCRENKATITSALYAIAVTVLSQIVTNDVDTSNSNKRKHTRITTAVATSMRPLSGISDIAFANHVSVCDAYAKLQPKFRWQDATQCAMDLKGAMKKDGTTSEQIGLLRFLFGQHAAYFKDQIGKKRHTTLGISNLGKFPSSIAGSPGENDRDSHWFIGRTMFHQTNLVSGAAFFLNVSGHGGGGLSIVIMWEKEALEERLAMKATRGVEDVLRSLIRGDTM